MSIEKKDYEPITIWVKGETKPQRFKTAIDALKNTKVIQSATSASIEIVERITNDGSTITSSQHATLRHWADSEISAITNGAKQLTFRDTKYVPVEHKLDRTTGEEKVYPAKLVFKASTGREQ
jgi:hypothetical protein